MAHPQPYHDHDQPRQDGAVRLWISQRQWMAILQDTERQALQAQAPEADALDCQRQSPRLPAPEDARCIIRLGENTRDHGTYLVKLRDISATGLGFNSAQPFAGKTRCTVALQDGDGHGMVTAARVVWCQPLEGGMHNVGIHFDQPIDPARFGQDSLDTEPPPNVPC